MMKTFELLLVELCSPTLIGVKPASLFTYQENDIENIYDEVNYFNDKLNKIGIKITILKKCTKSNAYLIYVYREKQLKSILSNENIANFLKQEGYHMNESIEELLNTLSDRLCLQQDFPHEIGIFLGYPLEDVVGFIKNKGKNCRCCGYWKVYGNPNAAKKLFHLYTMCENYCKQCFANGTSVQQLARVV